MHEAASARFIFNEGSSDVLKVKNNVLPTFVALERRVKKWHENNLLAVIYKSRA